MARIKCNVGKGGRWGEFQKDTVFELQGVEEHLQEWQQHAETQRNLTGGREERSPGDRGWGVERKIIAEWASGGPESKHPVSVQREPGSNASPQTPSLTAPVTSGMGR